MVPNEGASELLNKRVGEGVRRRRIDRRLTESELARTIGVSPEQLVRYEQGVDPFELTVLHATAKALDAPILELLAAADVAAVRPGAAGTPRDRGEEDTSPDQRLLQAFGRIGNDRIRSAVVEWIEAIASSVNQPADDQRRGEPAAGEGTR